MDDLSWDWLRSFEAVARLGSLTAAARALAVSQSTVSRHLAHLEAQAGSVLLLRETPVRLTDRGAALREAVAPMVESALAARAAVEEETELVGEVTVTTVGEMVRWLLVDELRDFYARYPQLRLRILSDNAVASLAAGEADIALRMARPERGDLVAKKVGEERFAFFASAALPLGEEVPWLGLTGSLAQIPEQLHAERAFASRPARLLLEDVESLGFAVKRGLGAAILPCELAARLNAVVEVAPCDVGATDLGAIPPRPVWMIAHRHKRDLPKVRATLDWLEETFARTSG